jgi:DNA-binding NarL/FixJ family response regulator
MDERTPVRVVSIDDSPIVAAGLGNLTPEIVLVAGYGGVADFLREPVAEFDVILLDLRFQSRQPGAPAALSGTAAIRQLLDAAYGPIVVYTEIAEDMQIAACLASGALGAIVKSAPAATVLDVLRNVVNGNMWVDPVVAGAIRRLATGRHAGALSPQQANALRYRGQGLRQQAIADRIGVKDPEIVSRYLKSAVEKLWTRTDVDLTAPDDDQNPGARFDRAAERSGLADGIVRYEDLNPLEHRPKRA